MKTAILFLSLLSATSQAALHTKDYQFKFEYQKETFNYSETSSSYDEAFESAAKACFDHYRDHKRVSMDKGMDIIDVCANPR